MKANEAPEKIYITPHFERRWFTKEIDDESTEYTRTDAFVEKACKFISDRVDIPFNVECSNGDPLADSYSKYALARLEAANKTIEEFKNYMKGD